MLSFKVHLAMQWLQEAGDDAWREADVHPQEVRTCTGDIAAQVRKQYEVFKEKLYLKYTYKSICDIDIESLDHFIPKFSRYGSILVLQLDPGRQLHKKIWYCLYFRLLPYSTYTAQ